MHAMLTERFRHLRPRRRCLSTKVFPSSAVALHDLKNGSSVIFGGFGMCGIPENLMHAIRDKGTTNLTVIGNDIGCAEFGSGTLIESRQISKLITAFVGHHKSIPTEYRNGRIELHLNPMGTLAEKVRCGGAGIPAFYTPAGVGTLVQTGGLPTRYNSDGTVAENSKPKETRKFNGREYVLEEAITADYACIKAWKGDALGNLVFRSTARNLNPDAAKAARIAIAEVEELVPVGELRPDEIHLPGIYVDRVVVGEKYVKPFEHLKHSDPPAGETAVQDMRALPPQSVLTRRKHKQLTLADLSPKSSKGHSHSAGADHHDKSGHSKKDSGLAARQRIARRAALEFRDGMNVNLGIGIPTLAGNHVPPSVKVTVQSENGLLGMGPFPYEGHADPDLVNASKEPVSYLPGSSVFSSVDSFAMIRGRHIDLTILGALEVSAHGDLASWIIPGGMLRGMGGAMDLLSGCPNIIAAIQHTNKHGESKILESCSLPLTGRGVVRMIVTELAVFTVDRVEGLTLIEHAEGVTVEEIREKTAAPFKVSTDLTVMRQ